MTANAKHYGKALFLLINETAENERSKITEKFISMLRKKKELGLLPIIKRELERLYEEDKNKGIAVTSAKSLNEKERQSIAQKDRSVIGKNQVRYNIDKTLVGGYTVQTKSIYLDRSYKKSLADLYYKIVNKT